MLIQFFRLPRFPDGIEEVFTCAYDISADQHSGEAFRYHRLRLVLVRSIPPNNSESSS